MPTHQITQSYSTPGGALTGVTAVTADSELNIDLTLAPSATNVLVACVITRANIKSIGLYCTGDATIKVNSSGAPTDTIVLVAAAPNICPTQATAATLFAGTASITALYVSSTAGGTFSLRAILDNSTNAP